MATFEKLSSIFRKASFFGFGCEILPRVKLRRVRNTIGIADFPKRIVGAKDPAKAKRGSFSEMLNCLKGKPYKSES